MGQMQKILDQVAQGMNGHAATSELLVDRHGGERNEADRNTSTPTASHFNHLELVRVIERMYRRYLDRLRVDLIRIGSDDISPSHAMLLFTIGDDDLSVRDLMDRGHYLGSNASYSLKQLVQSGYVDRTASERDRRSARIRLTEKGKQLCRTIKAADEVNQAHLVQSEADLRSLEQTFAVLRKLEVLWATDLQQSSPRLNGNRL